MSSGYTSFKKKKSNLWTDIEYSLKPALGSVGRKSGCSAGDMETSVQPLHQEGSLEEENGSSLQYFAGKIPWTEEPGRLWSQVSQKSQR